MVTIISGSPASNSSLLPPHKPNAPGERSSDAPRERAKVWRVDVVHDRLRILPVRNVLHFTANGTEVAAKCQFLLQPQITVRVRRKPRGVGRSNQRLLQVDDPERIS